MATSCSGCGADNPDAANYCRRCGRELLGPCPRSTTRVSPLMRRWRELSYNLTRKEVRQLLGEPKRIEAPLCADPSNVETWVYEYEVADAPGRVVSGAVMISVDQSRVAGWTEPPWP